MDAQTDGWLKVKLNDDRGLLWLRRESIDGVQVTKMGVGLHTRSGILHATSEEFERIQRDLGIVPE